MYIHPTPAVYLTKFVLRRGNQQGPPVMTPKASYERAQAATQMCRAMIEAQSTKHTLALDTQNAQQEIPSPPKLHIFNRSVKLSVK